VLWIKPPAEGEIKGVGLLDADTYLLVQEDQLWALNVHDGTVRWQYQGARPTHDALIHPNGEIVYQVSVLGAVEALVRTDAQGNTPETPAADEYAAPQTALIEPIWRVELEGIVFPSLLPLPGGGLIVLTQSKMVGLSASGIRLWERATRLWSVDQAWTDELLVLTGSNGAIWSMGTRTAVEWDLRVGGHLAQSSVNLLSYDNQGIHRLDLESRSSELIYVLPRGLPGHIDLALLPDGSALATHRDMSGGSLIALAPDGSLQWRRSYPVTFREQKELLTLGNRAYLLSQVYGVSDSILTIHEIDVENVELVPLFRSGSRDPDPRNSWFSPLEDERVLLHISGTGMLVLDLQAAREAAQSP
jgi:outer membrane protein assembly factor BamB